MSEQSFYQTDRGVTHGVTHHSPGDVFIGNASLDKAFEQTGGKSSDGEVLYKKATQKEYLEFVKTRDGQVADGSPVAIVGFAPTGEDSLTEAQIGRTADAQAGKAQDGDPIPPTSPEAARRAGVDEAEQPVEKVQRKAATTS